MSRSQNSGGGTAVAIKAPPKEIKLLLESAHDRLMKVMPKHLTPERMSQIVTTLVYKTPKLQQCPPATILSSVMEACELGFELSPKFGEAYLVPFYNKEAGGLICTMMPGYQGLVKLARNSGKIANIQARLVYQRDIFQVDYNPDLVFCHRPHLGATRGDRTLAYAVAKLTNGEHQLEFMDPEELEKVHRCSQGYQNAQRYNKPEVGPWVDWRAEQERKTVLKRLCKSLPRSIEMVRAIELDDKHYSVESVTPEPRRLERGQTRLDALERSIVGPAEEPEFIEGTSGAIGVEDEPAQVSHVDEDWADGHEEE